MDDLISDFIAETRESLEALDSELVRFEQHPEDPEVLSGIFRLIHTIKGTSGFLSLGRLQAVAHAAESVLGAFRDGELAVSPEAVSAVLETVDIIRLIVEALGEQGAEPAGDDARLIARLEAVMHGQTVGTPHHVASPPTGRPLIERLGGDATLDTAAEMIVDTLIVGAQAEIFGGQDRDLLQFGLRDAIVGAGRGATAEAFAAQLAATAPGAATPAAIEQIQGLLSQALTALEVDAASIAELFERMAPAVAAAMPSATLASASPPEPAQAPASEGERAPGPQTIRVSVDALEHLMTVASELVLIRNQLIQTLRLDPDSPFAGPLNRLNQVTTELQEGVMTTRMQPISGAWAKLPRLVRDLAQDLGKKIDLQLYGQETELDRQVLELIKDPLTHMIRNAADHGLEEPTDRLAAGKPEAGRITLAARHEGGAIVMEISDDGRGLPAAKIRAKAVASGLVSAARAEGMSDAEVRQFIFAAGFSTAGEVTAVSGRGVGMDVVRTNIEKIGGVIEVQSTEGVGTRFTIRIPLTLTIVSALIVECSGERFAIPQASVTELVSANETCRHRIEYIQGAAVLRLRDRLLPLISLQKLLKLDAEQAFPEETCIVVIRLGAFSFGLVVDRVFDTEEIVVKPVATVLRHLKVFSGATILGDGSVILILDPKGLSLQAGAGETHATEAEGDAAAVAGGEATASILVFRGGDGAIKAAPLSAVARIEEVESDQLERVDGRTVLQYRGRLMPVVTLDGAEPQSWSDGERRPLLVFNREERPVALLAAEVIDIVQGSIASDLAPNCAGAAGSLVIGGAATELIDVDHFWRRGVGAPDPVPGDLAAKRVLVIDQSPFSQMLLRPLLSRAGYDVTVAAGPEAALALHDGGERFHLIMADTSERGAAAPQLAAVLGQATDWRDTPLLGLGAGQAGGLTATRLADALSEDFQEMRGAA